MIMSIKVLCKLNSWGVVEVEDDGVGASVIFSRPTLVVEAAGAPFSFSGLSLVAVSLPGGAACVA